MAFLDKLQESGAIMWGLREGDRVFIETPTVYFLGEIEEVGLMHIKLRTGSYEIRTVNNLYALLTDGVWHRDDEVTPLPNCVRVPALSVTNVHDFGHPIPKPNRTPTQMRG